jgi:hypothetical protein
MYKFRKDRYQKIRGGSSRVLDIRCEHCSAHITYYQKDGPGHLLRMYTDRFIDCRPEGENLSCPKCERVLGVFIIFEKEKRPAYRLFAGAVTKKIVGKDKLVWPLE